MGKQLVYIGVLVSNKPFPLNDPNTTTYREEIVVFFGTDFAQEAHVKTECALRFHRAQLLWHCQGSNLGARYGSSLSVVTNLSGGLRSQGVERLVFSISNDQGFSVQGIKEIDVLFEESRTAHGITRTSRPSLGRSGEDEGGTCKTHEGVRRNHILGVGGGDDPHTCNFFYFLFDLEALNAFSK